MSTETADRWIHSWDAQQEHYAIGREERFTVIADVVAHATQGAAYPLVADLGCGPGSLAARLAVTHPHWEVVGVDADPLLLALGRASYGSTIRLVETVIGTDGWIEALELSRPLDAVVSSTALHYLPEKSLLEVYGQLHHLLRPGGVLVNADHFLPENAALSALTGEVGRRAAERRGVPGRPDWASWWREAEQAPELAQLMAERQARMPTGGADNGLSADRHIELLHKAGFAAAGPVWQYGHSGVLAALRR
ncbi:class I SAM-dependent methyltransferase [Streptomyces sp. CA-288835]|uniref:class I SAM-dependent methyltransferase n=1 Tax=Streptomyces sp. CA-288835 TaxID=3240069 RepID=UPI003D8A814F